LLEAGDEAFALDVGLIVTILIPSDAGKMFGCNIHASIISNAETVQGLPLGKPLFV
jgi:hypothetical protein